MSQLSEFKGVATTIFVGTDGNGDQLTYCRYHNTNVVTFTPKTIQLHSGGYRTVTTKRRMNQASTQFGLEFGVYQKDYDWFVVLPNRETVPFTDYLIIDRHTGGLI